jgi:hypothetical protein
MLGEGLGCDLALQCAAGQTIKEITFADWGLPYAAGADPLRPGKDCEFVSNLTMDSSGSVCSSSNKTLDAVRKLCVGKNACTISYATVHGLWDPCRGVHKRFAVSASGCAPVAGPPPVFVRDRFELGLYWDGGGNGAVPPEAAGSGPLPHSRYIGASPMAINAAMFDVWYFTDTRGRDGAPGYHLHPSSQEWLTRDSGTILDDDGVGNLVSSPASEWCAEAVQPGNLEVWVAELSNHKLAVSLLNRSPTAQNITVDWGTLGLASNRSMHVSNLWRQVYMGTYSVSLESEVPAFGVQLFVVS